MKLPESNDNSFSNFKKTAAVLKTIGHPARLKILAGLAVKKECNVNAMVKSLGLPQPRVSQHLNELKKIYIIKCVRKANQICYSLKSQAVKNLMRYLKKEDLL
ncbi:MAG TPA: metalloregulator ArsR/SmtB family transcription factor [bacterium]|nr:metalloregulator ArsR/SmtB family transcription factor [bacterium]HPN30042.1 metalloregulator ArsR/SmtB family transcription factor [bacterium]